MRQIMFLLTLVAFVAIATGCGTKRTVDFSAVAASNGMVNITTGDGEFDSYQGVGHYQALEIGLGLGLPGVKVMEVFPRWSNEKQVSDIAAMAKEDGSNALIQVKVPESTFYGFIFGIYLDQTQATGIKTR
jgi:ABC-type sugar transport system substrate-binding protein